MGRFFFNLVNSKYQFQNLNYYKNLTLTKNNLKIQLIIIKKFIKKGASFYYRIIIYGVILLKLFLLKFKNEKYKY